VLGKKSPKKYIISIRMFWGGGGGGARTKMPGQCRVIIRKEAHQRKSVTIRQLSLRGRAPRGRGGEATPLGHIIEKDVKDVVGERSRGGAGWFGYEKKDSARGKKTRKKKKGDLPRKSGKGRGGTNQSSERIEKGGATIFVESTPSWGL